MRKPRPGTVFLILWGIFLSGAVAVYLAYLQPSRLGRTISDSLYSSLGIRCGIRQVGFRLLPQPGVILRGVALQQGEIAHASFRAELCQVELSWLSVFRLHPLVRAVDIQGAVADVVWPPRAAQPAPEKSQPDALPPSSRPLPVLPRALSGMRIRIRDSAVRFRSGDGELRADFSGLNASARVPGLFRGHLEMSFQAGEIRAAKAPAVALGDFSLRLSSLRADRDGDLNGTLNLSASVQVESLEAALGHPVKPAYRYFPLPDPARVTLALDVNARPSERLFTMAGRADADLLLPMNGHDTPVKIVLPFSMSTPETIAVEGLTLDMDGEHAEISGELTGWKERSPSFSGRAEVRRFSLPRWFGFARKMPGGLQNALNDISGTMDFLLTSRGIEASRLEARILDMTLTGSGGCANFREPDIRITGHAGAVDLNPLFPEINGHKPDRPILPPPAVPLTEDESPAKVGYDIHLTADRADIWKLSAGKVDCHIIPAAAPPRSAGETPLFRPAYDLLNLEDAKSWPAKGALLTATIGDLYGGRAEGHVHLDENCRVLAAVRDAATDRAVADIAGFPAVGGQLRADVDLAFRGSSAGKLTATLGGRANAVISQGFFSSGKDARLPFRTLTLQAQVKALPPGGALPDDLPETMDYSGQWKAALDTEDWSVSTNGPAVLTFSMRNGLPTAMKPQPASFRLRLDKNGPGSGQWPEDLVLDINALTSFDMDAGTVTLANLSGGGAKMAVGGTLTARGLRQTPVIEGRCSLRTVHLREAAAFFGLSLPRTTDPAMFTTLDLEADVRRTTDAHGMQTLRLHNLRGRLDRTGLTGKLDATFGQRPFWAATLAFDALDLDDYWPTPSSGPSTPVQTAFLLDRDMDLKLSGDRVELFSTPLSDLKLAFTLKHGVGDTNVFTGVFPGGGNLVGTLHSEVRPGRRDAAGRAQDNGHIDARAQLRLTGVNMLSLTESRGQDTLVAGTGNGQLDLQAVLHTWGDIPSRLNGNWSIAVRDGYLTSAKAASGAGSQTPTPPGGGFGLSESGSPSGMTSPASGRTPFSSITATGNIAGGIIHTGNFSLKGSMLSVTGGGSINLNTQTISAKATATLLGVPEIPVEISGPLNNPRTSYKIVGAVAGTIGNLGGTVLDIVGGVLTAPFRLFGKKTITQP